MASAPGSPPDRQSAPSPRLEVRSRRIELTDGLLGRLPAARGVVAWLRREDGMVGWGQAARLEVHGADRFAAGRQWWQQQVSCFETCDDVGAPGTGPIAFASFTFDDESSEPSLMVVPEVVIGRRDGVAWLTTVGAAPRLSSPEHVIAPTRLRYSQGQSGETQFRTAVAEAVRRIGLGDLSKVVLAHDLAVTSDEAIDTRFVLAALADRYPQCWTFAVADLVGSTPELLLSLRDGRIWSRVLAGTVPRGADKRDDQRLREWLMHSDKDLDEHRYAVESLTAALAPYSASIESSSAPFLLELPNVSHLASDVRGSTRSDQHVLDLLSAVHPSAAVGGAPTQSAVDTIRELEGMDRGRYTGPVGWLDSAGDGEFGIALRCARLDGRTARLFAGCGIVAGSEPETEALEAQAKLAPMRDALEGVSRSSSP